MAEVTVNPTAQLIITEVNINNVDRPDLIPDFQNAMDEGKPVTIPEEPFGCVWVTWD